MMTCCCCCTIIVGEGEGEGKRYQRCEREEEEKYDGERDGENAGFFVEDFCEDGGGVIVSSGVCIGEVDCKTDIGVALCTGGVSTFTATGLGEEDTA